jgi:hypothetical protein
MDPGFSQSSINFGAAAFWFFIAAVVGISAWEKTRREAQKHETMRRIIEKTGSIDEARLKELFAPAPPSQWLQPPKPGSGYRGLRVAGAIMMFVAAGLALFFLILAQTGAIPQTGATIGLASTSIVALSGFGLFFSSRFVQPPPNESRNEPPAR